MSNWMLFCMRLWFYCPQIVCRLTKQHSKSSWTYCGNTENSGKFGHFCHWDKWQKVALFTLRTCTFKIHENVSHLPSTGQSSMEILLESLSVNWVSCHRENDYIYTAPSSINATLISILTCMRLKQSNTTETEIFPMFPTMFIPTEYIPCEKVNVEFATVNLFSWLNQFSW